MKGRITSGLTGLLLLSLAVTSVPARSQEINSDTIRQVSEMLANRQVLDAGLWNPEVQAQQYEKVFTRLWDRLLTEADKYAVLLSLPFESISTSTQKQKTSLELGITRTVLSGEEKSFTRQEWEALVSRFQQGGYLIEQSEWHHSRFVPSTAQSAARSEISMVIHMARADPHHRMIVRATLDVEWAPRVDDLTDPVPLALAVLDLEVLERLGGPVFNEVFTVSGTEQKPLLLPLLVQDLDGNGNPDIVLGGQNMLIRNDGSGLFAAQQWLDKDYSLSDAGIMADFTGNGRLDFIGVGIEGVPLLFEADPQGNFTGKPRNAAQVSFPLPKTFTAGDMDGDGDLDLFIGNYKYAYRQGQMPTPYFDANDGYPAHLLRNLGDGSFEDATEGSGLEQKRFRRSYSSSFVDLDDDGDQDLLVVSDFAGMDVYLNDGGGKFTDISDRFGGDRHSFGMSHSIADYNNDGILDFYVIGMSSTTARRLDRLGIGRSDKPEYNEKRAAMGYGNRMFLGQGAGAYSVAGFNNDVARTGWSWGASSFDFDNDGDKDLFVANGHVSGQSTQDYCTTFWRHDIYDDGSEVNLARNMLFSIESESLRDADISWNGYEHKVLLLNDNSRGFHNVAYLMGASFNYDGRGVVATDLDMDGRVDLMVVEAKNKPGGNANFVLHVYRNQLETAGNWIGFRLASSESEGSPVGAKLTLKSGDKIQTQNVVTGDSFSSQHPFNIHFGLGAGNSVDELEIIWSSGTKTVLSNPEINRYHNVKSGFQSANSSAGG